MNNFFRSKAAPVGRAAEILRSIDSLLSHKAGQVRVAPTPPLPPSLASDEVVSALCRSLPKPVFNEGEQREAERLAAEYDRAVAALNRHSSDHVQGEFARRQDRLAEAVLDDGDETTASTKEDVRRDFEARRAAARAAACRISAQAAKLYEAVAGRFLEYSRAETECKLVRDFSEHEAFGVPYSVSPLLQTQRNALKRVERDLAKIRSLAADAGLGFSPRALLAPFGLLPMPEPPPAPPAPNPPLALPEPSASDLERKRQHAEAFAAKERRKRDMADSGEIRLGVTV